MKVNYMAAALLAALALNAPAEESKADALTITRLEASPTNLHSLPYHTAGRVVDSTAGGVKQQWPGVYFETAFDAGKIFFKVGEGHVIYHVVLDNGKAFTLAEPSPGMYVVDGLSKKSHRLRIETVTESQSNANLFGGFFLADGKAKNIQQPQRQIEFIGDSHTVGYGNISPTRDCTTDDVWKTTDTSQAYGPIVAKHYQADYQINAISGRGIVRNYDGFSADTMPQAYPFALFNSNIKYTDPQWKPHIIVISLGTNDFSTPLKANEKWKSRDELRSDYEKTFIKFIRQLRNQHPSASFVLWATDNANGEVLAEVRKVVEQLRADGETKIELLPIPGLAMTGCHWHPSVADDQLIANTIINYIDSHPKMW